EQTLGRRLGHVLWRRRNVDTFLDGLYGSSSAKATGFKLMYNQLRRFAAAEDYLLARQVRAINVVRHNCLKVLVSRLRARASGVFRSAQGASVRKVHVPLDDLLERLARIEHEQQVWERRVGQRLPFLQVAYEDFVADPQALAQRMAD